MAFVNACPKNKAEYLEASGKLQCGTDKQGNIQYLCLPNQEKTSLVELCYDGLMGAREKGNCIEATFGKVIERSCRHFTSGCPNDTFWDYAFYKYPACQNIDTKHQCYVMDPSCSSQMSNEETSSHDTVVYIGSSLGGLILIIAVVIAIVILKRKRDSEKKDMDISNQEDGDAGNVLVMSNINTKDESIHVEEETKEGELLCCASNETDFICCAYQR